MKLSPDQIYALCYYLLGRGIPLDWGLAAIGVYSEIEIESLQDIQTRIFKCTSCNLWCDLRELDTDTTEQPTCFHCLLEDED